VPLLDATVPRSYVQLLYRPDYSQCPNSPTLKFHSPVSPDPLNARSLRSLGFPKSPPLKILDPPLKPITGSTCCSLVQYSSVQFVCCELVLQQQRLLVAPVVVVVVVACSVTVVVAHFPRRQRAAIFRRRVMLRQIHQLTSRRHLSK